MRIWFHSSILSSQTANSLAVLPSSGGREYCGLSATSSADAVDGAEVDAAQIIACAEKGVLVTDAPSEVVCFNDLSVAFFCSVCNKSTARAETLGRCTCNNSATGGVS